jgi:hypothetical protein
MSPTIVHPAQCPKNHKSFSSSDNNPHTHANQREWMERTIEFPKNKNFLEGEKPQHTTLMSIMLPPASNQINDRGNQEGNKQERLQMTMVLSLAGSKRGGIVNANIPKKPQTYKY